MDYTATYSTCTTLHIMIIHGVHEVCALDSSSFASHVFTVDVLLASYKVITLITVYLPGWMNTVALALSSGIRTWVSEM